MEAHMQVVRGSERGKVATRQAAEPTPTLRAKHKRKEPQNITLVSTQTELPSCYQEFTVHSAVGLHLRPAATLVKVCSSFECDILIRHGGQEAPARSLLSVVLLQAGPGARVQVVCKGRDALVAMAAIAELFDTNFGEMADGTVCGANVAS